VKELIGTGPWARLFATAVVRDEGSSEAERGRSLALAEEVHSLAAVPGTLSGKVFGNDGFECTVTIEAAPVSPRVWAAVTRFARGSRPLAEAVAGREQSVHLEHLMTVDWEEPLVPPARAITTTCSCHAQSGVCEHVTAVAYAAAAAIDADPSLLLRWRGCVEPAAAEEERPEASPAPAVATTADPWRGGELPEPRPLRPLPVGAVLKRLGPSGLRVGPDDLVDVLQRAYASFASRG
jgi:uncharacterized Zn finger protein